MSSYSINPQQTHYAERTLELVDLHPMRISQRGLYALQALVVLARHYSDDVIKIHDIAKEEQLPEKFLETILRDLKRGRFVSSSRGVNGGYRLQRPPPGDLSGTGIAHDRRPTGAV